MSVLIKEIAGLEPYNFISCGDTAEFTDAKDNRIGVIFEFIDLNLPDRVIEVCNVAFGVLNPEESITMKTINQSLTGANDLRKVISTVGEIVVSNTRAQATDVIVLAGADDAKERRQQIYAIAALDILNKMPRFKRPNKFKIANGDGAVGIFSPALDLTPEEIEFIGTNLSVTK